MFGPIGPLQLVIILAIVLIIFGTRYGRPHIRRLRGEIRNEFPVFSTETTQRREAEFIRDRLPTRLPLWFALIALLTLGALAWWLMN
jgi:Sec-independent protein translocase protein TatA